MAAYDVAWVELRVLGNRLPLELAPTLRASGLEATRGELLDAPRGGAHDAVIGTGVAALAVHDHARRQHEAPRERPGGECPQQDGRAGVVVADIVGDVEEIVAEADHSGLVADALDADESPLDGRRVADVALDEVRLRRKIAGDRGVGQERVEHPHLASFGEQGVDDMRADEAGPTRDEDHRDPAAARTRVMSRIARTVPRSVPVTFERPARGR